MGTVLSFNPRDRHPVYSSQPNFPYNQSTHIQSQKINDNSESIDSQLNNFSYEQLNNAKNRENKKAISHQISKNGSGHQNTCGSVQFNMHTQISSHNFNNLAYSSKDTINNDLDAHNENSTVISEKSSIEKSLKKHSLFINALSWKKLSTAHNKKKVENKNKCANLPTTCFKTQLLEASYTSTSDKNKNIQLHCNHIEEHQHQQHHCNQSHIIRELPLFPSTKTQKPSTAKELGRVNNTNSISNHNKLIQKQPLALTLPQQLQISSIQIKNTNQNHLPRKTVIQVTIE